MKLYHKKVSIIVSVLNGSSVLESCLDSVFKQEFKDYELIIIDGGSVDGTIEILEKHSDKIDYWKSENDLGVFDAWNKALSKAAGEWLCFIGSDDVLLPDSLSKYMSKADFPAVNFVSSRVMMVDDDGAAVGSIGKPWDFDDQSGGMGVVHCGAFHHRSLFDEYGVFDHTYKLSGDFDFLLRVGRNVRASFLNEITVNMCDTGQSRTQVKEVIMETSRILYEHPEFGRIYGIKYFIFAHLSSVVRRFVFLFPFGNYLFSLRNRLK
jgi:glycosyltransferase involved in cell wall biosynthesis